MRKFVCFGLKIESGIYAILVKVAAMGLDPHKHLGKDLATLQPHFIKLNEKHGCNICGEGGEYGSLTLDCCLFRCCMCRVFHAGHLAASDLAARQHITRTSYTLLVNWDWILQQWVW